MFIASGGGCVAWSVSARPVKLWLDILKWPIVAMSGRANDDDDDEEEEATSGR